MGLAREVHTKCFRPVHIHSAHGVGVSAAHRQREGPHLHLMRGDARAKIGIGDLAVGPSDIVERGVFQVVTAAAAAETAGRNVLPLILQQPLGDLPSAIELADELLLRNLHIGEERFAERRLTADQLDRPRLDAGR